MNDFCAKIADILDVEDVTLEHVLRDFPEWDSLSVLSVIAMVGADYGLNLSALQLKDVGTVGDLWALVQANKPV